METILDEINRALAKLGLTSAAMELLQAPRSAEVFGAALDHFVASGDGRWWWEDFRQAGMSVFFEDGQGWRQVPQIAPVSDELIWFIAEDDSLPHYPVFETTPEVASLVIGECYGFEYYVIAKDFSWLLCENHHNVLCAVGAPVEARLMELS
ncbi:hypothetical protein KY495_01370 [Massilia sp. PAMC28688]|uniref:DUF6756 family protein n=1 Tax=Massilia sp. PAMC28688 TaxID=2861283 RepID=UPI001C6289FE|nr:DUF6756 family protein [Massilia sp. PAMC28688]QYF93921.1 hypothetical protein KY495_01370 [Massilia sp. PAMC28688]